MAIYKRGGVYWYNFVFNGDKVQRSTKVGNAKDARDIERAAWNQLARGEVGLNDDGEKKHLTISQLLDRLEAHYAEGGPISQQKRSELKQARAAFGSKLAAKLTEDDSEAYISTRRKQGKKNASINRITEVVRRAYRVAKITPPEIRHLSEAGNARKGFFSDAEFKRVHSHLPEDLRDFAFFGYLTGWRKGEIASLSWSDIEEGVIRLRAENSKNREARSVVIAGALVTLIERRKQARLANKVLTKLVFHRDGEPVQEFRKSWATACVAAGLGKMVCPKCKDEGTARRCQACKLETKYRRIFHDFRRTGVRNMVRSGVPQSVAMKISGHKTASMFRRYDISNEDDLRSAMESVQRYNEAQAEKVVTIASNR